jgi:hypothetical protein
MRRRYREAQRFQTDLPARMQQDIGLDFLPERRDHRRF